MADPIAQLCQIIAEQLRDEPELEQADLVVRVERAIASNAELAAALKTDPRMLQINRDGARGFQTSVEAGGTVFIEGTHYHLAEPEKFEAALEAVLQTIQTPKAKTFDFKPYLQSIIDDENYQEWQALYIPLRVERVKLKEEHKSGGRENPEQREQVEQWEVLAGLRHYAPDHVLLMGKPGSGKSTALRQLLWEEAQNALAAIERGETNFKIPVLIELHDRKEEAIVNRIQTSLRRARLDVAAIEELLLEGRFLLLFDGLNEIPTPAIWSELQDFQGKRDFRKNPRIFTTRELGAEAELGLEIKLTLLPLTEPQMRAFIENRLPGRAEILLHQLKDRLRELAETPLLLKILCDVVKESPEGHLPTNRGELFRQEFARRYQAFKPKRGYVPEDSRHLTEWLLQQLAFEMIKGHSPTDLELQISRNRAIQVLQNFLQNQGETDALSNASEYLEDLLEWDLLQVAADSAQIEFHHQLFQEYYAAEYLLLEIQQHPEWLEKMPGHQYTRFQQEYLNLLKWTEPIALMLGLATAKGKKVENETEKEKKRVLALQLVKLALEVDWQLGARLAGEVRQEFQDQTVALVNALEVPRWLKVELLGKTCSEAAFPALLKALGDPDSYLRWRAVQVFGKIGSEAAIPDLLKAIEDSDYSSGLVRGSAEEAVEVLGSIGSKKAVPGLLKALKVPSAHVRRKVAMALGQIGSEAAIPGLLDALEDSDHDVRWGVVLALGQIGSEEAIPGLLRALEHSPDYHRQHIYQALEEIGIDAVISLLLKVLEDSADSGYSVSRCTAAKVLGQIGSEAAIPGLLKALEDSECYMRECAAQALGEIKSESAIPGLCQLLKDENSNVRGYAAAALGQIGSKVAIPDLIKALEEDSTNIFLQVNAVKALGQIRSETAIPGLLKALEHPYSEAAIPGLLKLLEDSPSGYVRKAAAKELKQIGSETAVPGLLKALEDSDCEIRWYATTTLGQIGSEMAISGLLKALNHSNADVRLSATVGLGQTGSGIAISGLLKALEDSDCNVRRGATEALAQIDSEACISGLRKALKDSDCNVRESATKALALSSHATIVDLLNALKNSACDFVRCRAVEALGQLDSEMAIPGLLKAVEDSDYSVRERAAKALSSINGDRTASILPKLRSLILERITLDDSFSVKEAFPAIAAIQNRCKFYNYEIWQAAATIKNLKYEVKNRRKYMADQQPTISISGGTFNAPVNLAPNQGNQPTTIIGTQYNYFGVDEALCQEIADLQQFIADLEAQHPNVQTESEANQIVKTQLSQVQTQNPDLWQKLRHQMGLLKQQLLNPERHIQAAKATVVEVTKAAYEKSLIVKAILTYLDKLSEDPKHGA